VAAAVRRPPLTLSPVNVRAWIAASTNGRRSASVSTVRLVPIPMTGTVSVLVTRIAERG
jgi:hypothetical protein